MAVSKSGIKKNTWSKMNLESCGQKRVKEKQKNEDYIVYYNITIY